MRLPITYRAFRSSGPGGQNRNKVFSAIEASVTLPDGRVIKATSQTERDQTHNKRLATRVLAARVRKALDPGPKDRYAAGHERIRTYHEPDNRVTDHASGAQWSWRETVGKGDISQCIEARAKVMLGKVGG